MDNALDIFKDFIFPERIEDQLLELFVSGSPNLICFHGNPGIGKSSFARAYSKALAEYVTTDAVNEIGANFITRKYLEEMKIGLKQTTVDFSSFMEEEVSRFRYQRAHILDEFHDLTIRAQNRYKARFEDLRDDELCIVTLNTTNTRTVRDVLSPAIFSRLHCINLDIRRSEFKEVAAKVSERYPLLSEATILSRLPDLRSLTREGRFSERLAAEKSAMKEKLQSVR